MNKDMLIKGVLSYSSAFPKECLLKAPQVGPFGLMMCHESSIEFI